MKISYLKPKGRGRSEYLEAVARARGCQTEAEIADFIDPSPPIPNHISLLPDYQRAADRLRRAMGGHQRILLFGDWDCDGITALVQMHDLIGAAGHEELQWFIPDRRADDYGLTQEGVEKCYELFKPHVVIAVDCGSPSHKPVQWLKDREVDTIIFDHHQLGSNTGAHPACAHMNPKACASDEPEIGALREMSAGGLVYLFCEQFAKDEAINNWDQKRSLILGGLSTVVDVMRLTGVNRALVKQSLHLAANPVELARVPGLVALNQLVPTAAISVTTYGFVWGPRLNATGRLEEATAAVKLLLARTTAEALQWATRCHAANEERRKIQATIAQAAFKQAGSLVDNAEAGRARILVLFNQDWHHGVVGIVASKIKEHYSRPAIVLGWHEDGFYKGSGRSIPAYDMGDAVSKAVSAGVILSGGGHRMAAGLKVDLGQVDPLRSWLNSNCGLSDEDCMSEMEILGRCESLSPEQWCEIFDTLEPFGNGNPRPLLYLSKAKLTWGPNELTKRDGGSIWAMKAGFTGTNGTVYYCTWSDLTTAKSMWRREKTYNLALNLSRSVGADRVFYNWRVMACDLVG